MWNDKTLKWNVYGLQDRKEIQAAKPPLGSFVMATMERKMFFVENTQGSGGSAKFADLNGSQIEVTKTIFNKLDKHLKKIPEVLTRPDEIYLTRKGEKYQYSYIKFYKELALELVCDFKADQPFRIRSIKPFKGRTINDIRKGVLIYG